MSYKQKYTQNIIKRNLAHKYNFQTTKLATQSKQRTYKVQSKYCADLDCPILYKYIINCITQSKSYVNTYRINYQDVQIMIGCKQYLKRFYRLEQYCNKNQALTQYYKFHINYPIQIHLEPNIYIPMINYQEMRNNQQRKFIKKLMNQPQSVSVSEHHGDLSKSYDAQSLSQRFLKGNQEYSLKLKQLYSAQDNDSDKSSVILEHICEKIGDAFQEIKPLYFYKGIYNDGVKQFKAYMHKMKNESLKNKRKQMNNINYMSYDKNPKCGFESKKVKQSVFLQDTDELISNNTNSHTYNQNKMEISKQSSNKQEKTKTKIYFKSRDKITNTKQLRKIINNNLHTNINPHANTYSNLNFNNTHIPNLTLKGISKRPNLTRVKRNKTATTILKPQSFSKNTEHQTISKQQCTNTEMANKKRIKSAIRIRNCKSTHNQINANLINTINQNKIVLIRNRSNTKIPKFSQLQKQKQKKNIENQYKNFNKQKVSSTVNDNQNNNLKDKQKFIKDKSKTRSNLKITGIVSKTKRQLKKIGQKDKAMSKVKQVQGQGLTNRQTYRCIYKQSERQTERALSRQDSKPNLSATFGHKQKQRQKKGNKFQSINKQNALNNLIKNKLKLRA